MKMIIALVVFFSLSIKVVNGQDSKLFLRVFPSYKVDTVHIEGNPVLMKRHVISVLHQEGIRSAFWDDTDNILTIVYDSSTVRLRDIRRYFYNSVKTKNTNTVAKARLDY